MDDGLNLLILSDRLSICRLNPGDPFPVWADSGTFISITRTADELSMVCSEKQAPAGVLCESGWRAIKFEGTFDFSLIGVLTRVAVPLAEAGVSILAISTFDTDYVLVRETQLDLTIKTLEASGHVIRIQAPRAL